MHTTRPAPSSSRHRGQSITCNRRRTRRRTTFLILVLVVGIGVFVRNEWSVAHQVSLSLSLPTSTTLTLQSFFKDDQSHQSQQSHHYLYPNDETETETETDHESLSMSSMFVFDHNTTDAQRSQLDRNSPNRDRRLLSYMHDYDQDQDQDHDNSAQVWAYRTEMRANAIIYLAQRQLHSTYSGRNSFSLLLKSLRLLYESYLRNYHHDVDIYILHTGDFTTLDYPLLQAAIGGLENIKLLNLNNTKYWKLPDALIGEDVSKWRYMSTRRGQIGFSLGYRHMCRLMSLGIWDLFQSYQYVWRLDEDSFIYSSIDYNIFDFMKHHDYVYGYRLVTYELWEIYDEWNTFMSSLSTKNENKNENKTMTMTMTMQRPITRDKTQMAMYNNFFVAKVSFFRSQPVQQWLSYVDRAQLTYRKRLGDLLIHSATVYAYAPQTKVHRFLDFSYQHMTILHGCPVWGAFQTGYKDTANTNTNAMDTTTASTTTMIYNLTQEYANCTSHRINALTPNDLSPTYHHLVTNHNNHHNHNNNNNNNTKENDYTNITLVGFVAGSVEASEGRGIKSG